MDSFIKELVSNASAKLFPDKNLTSLQNFAAAIESGGALGECNFGNILPINVPKSHWGKIYVLLHKFSKLSE